MLGKFIAYIAVKALRSKRLTGEQKAFVTSALLANLHALPIASVLKTDENGNVFLRGKRLAPDQAIAVKESAAALQNSAARLIINDQLKFMAISIGVHDGLSPDGIIFSKAALWIIQEEEKLITTLGGELSTDDALL